MPGAIQSRSTCTICQQTLGEDPSEMVAISKRCHDVFHKTCIERWLEQGRRNCPNCELGHFSKYEVVPNPENTLQYRKWHDDPEGYTYEKAYEEEYGKPYSLEDAGFPAEHIIRPRELRGELRRDKLTKEEIFRFYNEMSAAIKALDGNSTREQIDKAKKECEEAEALIYQWFREDFAELRRQNVIQFAKLAELSRYSDHQELLSGYYRKIDAFEKKINVKLSALRALSYQNDQQFSLLQELSHFDMSLGPFDERFRLDGRINERSIEESQALLRQVDAELDAFIESQPEHIKAILNAPLPIIHPPEERPAIGSQWQNVIFSNITRRRCIKGFIYLAAFVAMTMLWRKGIPAGFKFWQDRAIKPLPKALENQVCS